MTLTLVLALILGPTPPWLDAAAAVVAGEAPAGCIECYRLVACTILYDIGRDWDPAALLNAESPRWHGRRAPREEHYRAVEWALNGGCAELPTCAYLGNLPDLAGWYRSGLVAEGQEVRVYGGRTGAIACVVAEAEVAVVEAVEEREIREDWQEWVR